MQLQLLIYSETRTEGGGDRWEPLAVGLGMGGNVLQKTVAVLWCSLWYMNNSKGNNDKLEKNIGNQRGTNKGETVRITSYFFVNNVH